MSLVFVNDVVSEHCIEFGFPIDTIMNPQPYTIKLPIMSHEIAILQGIVNLIQNVENVITIPRCTPCFSMTWNDPLLATCAESYADYLRILSPWIQCCRFTIG